LISIVAKALFNDEAATRSVGIWIRVSTEDQARGESPEHHEKRARCYAEAKGWAVREVYRLEGGEREGGPRASRSALTRGELHLQGRALAL
jgi:site-specific DNA recombinase